MIEKYELTIEPLTYIHIGSGKEITPESYIIKDGTVYFLNEISAIKALKEAYGKTFDELLDRGNLIDIQLAMKYELDLEDEKIVASSYSVDEEFAAYYEEKFEEPENQNIVNEFIKNPFNKIPYIPGSSIKGAMRTSIVSILMDNHSKRLNEKMPAKIIEGIFLKCNKEIDTDYYRYDAAEDPFKFFKVADANFYSSFLNIKLVENRNQSFSRESVPHWYGEVLDFNKSDKLKTSIGFDRQFTNKTNIGISDLPKLINEFYLKLSEKEKSFYKSGKKGKFHNKLLNIMKECDENEFCLKLGKGSGRHFLTLKEFTKFPKCRNFVDHYPLGWCKCSLSRLQ